MIKVDIKGLFEAGAHFGHKTSRWHPRMAPYIYGKRGNIHIIDLEKTAEGIDAAAGVVETAAAKGKQVMFVGTRAQFEDLVKNSAEAAKSPYVVTRWIGGMLTNSKTMNERVKHLKKLEERMASGELEAKYSKLEVQRFQEEIDAMNVRFGGIKELKGKPGAVFVLDAVGDELAVKEAAKLGVPVIAICDSNADPILVDHVIPANDDSIVGVEMIANYIVKAVQSGQAKMKQPTEETSAKENKK